jgi:hypothetical protein
MIVDMKSVKDLDLLTAANVLFNSSLVLQIVVSLRVRSLIQGAIQTSFVSTVNFPELAQMFIPTHPGLLS